ncbi:MAG: HAMP domain-containing sensor histidine kinase [Bacteroidota bacterium]
MKAAQCIITDEIKAEHLIVEHVAHDLKEIITKFDCLNKLLQDKLEGSNDMEIERLIRGIDSVCNHGYLITKDLLTCCILDSFNEMEREVYSLNQLIDQQAKLYELQADKKQIDFQIILPVQQFFFELDCSKFIRVLDNLFSNALKFTEKGGQIKIELSDSGGKATIAVSDSGVGVPIALQNNLFNRYSNSGQFEEEKHTRLGLYIVKKIIDLHKGKVWFNTEENKGSTFYVELSSGIIL